jgi:hypothetical protein
MRQIQWPSSILLNTPMQRLNPHCAWSVTRILQELQPSPSKPILRLENTLIVNCHFHRDKFRSIEARAVDGRELEDFRPFGGEVLHVIRVEDRVCGVGVEERRGGASGDTAVEDNCARGISAPRTGGERKDSACSEKNGGERGVHDGGGGRWSGARVRLKR